MKSNNLALASMPLTEDKFLGDRLTVSQPQAGYRAGVDAVLLAATVPIETASLLDIGAGVGTIGLCAAARLAKLDVTLLEREASLVEIARANIAANGMENRVRAVNASVTSSATELAEVGLAQETFDHCLANPPFHDEDAGTPAPHALKANAHAMPADALDDWVRFMARMVKPNGRASMIHKAETLPRVLECFVPRFGALVVYPIFPRAGESAIRVIVSGIKGSKAPVTLRPGIILHGDGNGFTREASGVLRQGAPLEL